MKVFSLIATVALPLWAAHSLGDSLGQPTRGDAQSLAAAERAFAAEATSKGTRAAFLDLLSDDGIVFEPDPQNGKKYWSARAENADRLQWQPVLAVVAAQGDLGYTTGPWRFRKAGETTDSACGEFVSIWRWTAGKWKLVLDLGNDHPAPTSPPPALQTVDLKSPNESRAPDELLNFLGADRSFAKAPTVSFAKVATDDVRVYRAGKFPAIGRVPVGQLLTQENAPEPTGDQGAIARGGDLAYVWGKDGSPTKRDFLRIWRKDTNGWKLALDLLQPR